MPAERRLTSAAIRARKGAAFPMITAYDAAFARCVEEAGIDFILVGDSLGNVVLGYPSTVHVELSDMLRAVGAVARGTQRAHIVGDLPFGTYEPSDAAAVDAAVALVKAGADSVKLEGGVRAASRIRAIVAAGIPVVGHIGVVPQTAALDSGFRRKTDADALLADAQAVEDAGAYAIVLEMIDGGVAGRITAKLKIPTIGIGSGPDCDGQVLVLHDALGLYPEAPPFAKRFGEIARASVAALRAYAKEVRERAYPPKT